jgi:Fe-S cluster biogenesis protein NfuA
MDEDELDDYLQMMAESRAAVSSSSSSSPLFVDATSSSSIDSAAATAASDDDSNIISPFESDTSSSTPASNNNIEQEGPLELNKENVDKVLDEVRPYLISDGGNVSVHNVDTTTGNVYLVLEGACGSCASSTVTMQMGIERVLKEKFEEKLGEVIQVDPNDGDGGDGGKPTELTMDAVQSEVKRISQAITAMGGVVRVVSVDKIGVVEIEFRGPNKVKKGLELALLDVEYVKHVKFVS